MTPSLPPGTPTLSLRGLLRCLGALLALAALLAPARAQAQPPVQDELVLREALRVVSDADRFPVGATAAVVPLPDLWDGPADVRTGSVWYRVRFDLPADAGREPLLALWIERVCSRFELQLNGQPIHGDGRAQEPLTRDCHRAQRITLPTAWLKPKGNLLDLRVTGHPLQQVAALHRAGGLSALVIAPQDRVAARHAGHRFWNIDAVIAVNGVLAVLGLLLLGLGWIQRRQRAPMHLGAIALMWALLSARSWWREPPLPSSLIEFLVLPGFALITAVGVRSLLSGVEPRLRSLEVALLVQAVVVPASLWLAGPDHLFGMVEAWGLLLTLELAAAGALFLRTCWQRRRRDVWAMVAVYVAAVAGLAAELAVQHRLLPSPPVPLMSLALPLLMTGVGLRLLQLHALSLRSAEAGRVALEGRLQEITADVERRYAQLAEARVEQVIERERKRIAADLHDDLGAKLLTIVHTSESERISSLAREALEEMRLSVRGLTGKPMKLADALADWRAETVSRLGQANIEIDWRGPAEDADLELPARSYVQTTRILRESVSNIIKHSGASHVKVRCAIREQQFGLNIQDNGKGIPMDIDTKLDRGHGMASMKHRAKQMHGQCLFESGPGYGTVIRLTLPL